MNAVHNRNYTIDLAKYIASLMVVAIHSGLFADVDDTLYFVVVQIICRLAVPYFAVCTGYFMGRRFKFENAQEQAKNSALFIGQWKKCFNMYALWTIIYMLFSIPFWIEIGWFSPWAFVDYALAACTKGSYYHLWYLWGMIYVLPVLYAILRWIPCRYWNGIIIVLWLLKVLGYAYISVIYPAWQGDHYLREMQEAFLCLLPLLLLGVSISQQTQKSKRFCLLGFAGNFFVLSIEAFFLRNSGKQSVSFIIFTLPTAYFLFQYICQINIRQKWMGSLKLGEVSMLIYCVHPIFISIMEKTVPNSIARFVLCTILSTALGCLCSILKEKINRKKVRSCFN